jgi:hypothetical protein
MALVQYPQIPAAAWAMRPGRRCSAGFTKAVKAPFRSGNPETKMNRNRRER